jgi:3-oxoacyl-[acyl-carrier-protein] synthase-3
MKIASTGRALPSLSVSNGDLAKLLDTSDEWIRSKNGIESRFLMTTESLSGLASQAGVPALAKAGLKSSDIDLIICSTISGDFTTPSLACAVSQTMGLSCPAHDINAACSGFIYALDVADAFITSGKASNFLIIAAKP